MLIFVISTNLTLMGNADCQLFALDYIFIRSTADINKKNFHTQQTCVSSKSAIETLEKDVKYVVDVVDIIDVVVVSLLLT